ncbi:MAG: AAA family ATPase [Phycisphaerales bacterium]|nr:AAA family ATPase [Phycisphaerales bacterium]
MRGSAALGQARACVRIRCSRPPVQHKGPTLAETTAALKDPQTPEEVLAAAARFREDFAKVRDQVSRVMVGQTEIIENVLICLFVGGHVLLEGVPGIGKTLLVRTLARALDLSFSRIQFTPDLMPADISGTTVVLEVDSEGGRRERVFRFQPGPVFAQILLADEINRATPKTQSALLEAMQERSVTVGGTTHALPSPFLVMATQNPIEQEGTYPLPEAQLDRFFFKLLVGVAKRAEMAEILNRTTGGVDAEVRPALNAAQVLAHQRLIRRVAIAPYIQDYAVRMVLATHPGGEGLDGGRDGRPTVEKGEGGAAEKFSTPMVDKFVRLGASPRAAQALVLAAKCRALLDGRAAVATDDIRRTALPALRHRLILNFESHAEGVTADAIVQNIVQTLPLEAGV